MERSTVRFERGGRTGCVLDSPMEAASNVLVKGIMLFINWGQLLPYTRIPGLGTMAHQCMTALLLVVRGRVFWSKRRREAELGTQKRVRRLRPDLAAVRYAVLGCFMSWPSRCHFAVDSRYLLGPFLITLAWSRLKRPEA